MVKNYQNQVWQISSLVRAIAAVISFAIASRHTLPENRAFAQIIPDATLGNESSIVTPNVVINGIPADQIDGGAIRGTNLFHSFQEFNVSEGERVYFTTPLAVNNILARVTGLNPSNINGLLGVLGDDVTLFFINPNGIIFGPNAQLDTSGSFVGTTANAIRFPGGGEFSATSSVLSSSTLLTVNPSVLFFNQTSTGAIVTQFGSGLQVPDGESLLLVGNGNNISLNSTVLRSAGGSIEIGGLAGAGEVNLIPDGNNLTLSFPDGVALADVSLNNTLLDTSGGDGGTIQIQGNRVTLTNGSRIVANTLGGQNGIGVPINIGGSFPGTDVSLNNTLDGQNGNDSVLADVPLNNTLGGQNGGGIFIQSSQLDLSGNSIVSTSTVSSGNAGSILIQTRDSVTLSDASSFIGSTVTESATGNGGDVRIEAEKLIAQDGGQIFTSTLGEGKGGNLIIKTSTPLETGQVVVQNGAQITVSNQGAGEAGDLMITADSIYMDNQGRISTARVSGNSANIFMDVRDSIILRHDSDIRTDARGNGRGGNITIEVGDFILAFLPENSDIIASAYQGQGGNIIATTDAVFGFKFDQNVDTPESDFTASSELGIDGTITINSRNDSLEVPSLNDFSEKKVVASCQRRQDGGIDEFFITGRGGLPPSPYNSLEGEAVITNWVSIDSLPENNISPNPVTSETFTSQPPPQLVEAQGWIVNEKGEIVLTASAPTVTPQESGFGQLDCNIPSRGHDTISAK